tara:strand:- start:149 stop:868 length:720 start_codon:yes stop_codon:yes gene_type:complete
METEEKSVADENPQELVNEFYVNEVQKPTGTSEYIAFLGYVFIGLGVLDFLLSFTGTNITFFLGFLSTFTPIIFGAIGGALISQKDDINFLEIERFSESDKAKAIYAGTVVAALIFVGVFGALSNFSNADIVGEWYDPYDKIEFQSDGDVVHTTSSDISIIGWRVDGNDLFLEWSDDRGYEYLYKYQISEEFLFVAPYADPDDGTVSGDECWAMSSDKDGENENYWNDVNFSPPEWCNI